MIPRNPDMVLVETTVITQAPVRFLLSGISDALATRFEAEDCRIKLAGNMTGRQGPMTVFSLARLCFDTRLKYGVQAKNACEQQKVTPLLSMLLRPIHYFPVLGLKVEVCRLHMLFTTG